MRELKFRAWSEETKSFEYFDLYKGTECGLTNLQLWARNSPIEQYTGLKDKNGKEIYEGDILRFKSGPKSVVKFCEIKDSDCTYFYLGWASVQDGCEPMSLCEEAGFCEVIGNIHENPELLGEEEE